MTSVEIVASASPYPHTLWHYTSQAGYNAIVKSQKLKASTVEGKKSTHYGKGVYLTNLSPTEMSLWTHYEGIRRIFAEITTHSVDRTRYFVAVTVDEKWHPVVAHFTGSAFDDIYIVRGESDLNIQGRIFKHGETDIGYECDKLPPATAARDYGYRLNQKYAKEKSAIPDTVDSRPLGEKDLLHSAQEYARKHPNVVINGKTQKRPEGWYEDYYSQN